MSIATEHILVVPTSLFHSLGYFQGFSTDTDRYFKTLLSPQNTSYRPRPAMEQDPSFKQLIPYCLFRYTTPTGEVQLFQYTRGGKGGEKRLHAKRSVGIGGHISSDDSACHSPYEEGLRRELAEEVLIETPYTGQIAGMINDDLSDVGKVHLGVVHLFDVESPDVFSRDEEIVDAGFRPVPQLLAEIDQFETWSQIVLKALFL